MIILQNYGESLDEVKDDAKITTHLMTFTMLVDTIVHNKKSYIK